VGLIGFVPEGAKKDYLFRRIILFDFLDCRSVAFQLTLLGILRFKSDLNSNYFVFCYWN